eukprot:gene29337-38416_t
MKQSQTFRFLVCVNAVLQISSFITSHSLKSTFSARHLLDRTLSKLLSSTDPNEIDLEVSLAPVVPLNIASNFGSDVLVRPEDEDSPEFKEYLRQLLKMQANRAKSGHAAPSSGSADAYISKLTRLKIEKNMRMQAGLPNDALDNSYKPEDYSAAIYEGQEPVVSASTGLVAVDPRSGRSSGTGKVRRVTNEELAITQSAEANVRKALEMKLKGEIDGIEPASPLPPALPRQLSAKRGNDESDLLIDQLLGKTQAPPSPQQKSQQKQQQIAQAIQQQKSVSIVEPQQQKKAVVPPQQQQSKPQPPQQQQKQQQPQQAAAPAAFEMKRKLESHEVEDVGKALEWLVKHRGGGRFGMGRLEGAEREELAAALRAAARTLEKDSSLAEPVKVQPKKQIREEQKSLPKIPVPSAVLPSPPAARAAPVPAAPAPAAAAVAPAAANPASAPPATSLSFPPPAANEPIPIAFGLDKFLQDPKKFDLEELSALRDGIIQCLGLIQSELTAAASRPPSPPALPTPTWSPPELETTGPSLGLAAIDQPAPFERELKQTLGILLKHRGGPGFGHGRLQGRELELMEKKLRQVATVLAEEAQSLET